MNQKGDTIIEVMIVLAVLSLSLSISYATADRSLLNTRQAQESSMAAELAQSQVESLIPLINYPASSPNNIFLGNPSKYFCISAGSVVPENNLNPNNLTDIAGATTPYETPCNTGLYFISINESIPNDDTFEVKVTWNDVENTGPNSSQDQVTLDYRAHQQL